MEAIIAAVISGAVALLASLIANSRSRAITDTKLGSSSPTGRLRL